MTHLLTASELSYSFTSNVEHQLLSGINLEVMSGQLIILTGSNGAGKSTLLRILSGNISHSSGCIIRKAPITPLLFPGIFMIHDLDMATNISLCSSMIKSLNPRATKPQDIEDSFLIRQMSSLSKGELAYITLQLGFSSCTSLLLIDELFDCLDEARFIRTMATMSKHLIDGGAAIVVSHNPSRFTEIRHSIINIHRTF